MSTQSSSQASQLWGNIDVVESFFGVYLLYSLNAKYKGRIYIGYTVDPNRRINQHNKGSMHGGARRTNNRGPWEMVLIVHGFPNDISALRFEWAWQHPDKSRRLKSISRKKQRETHLDFTLRVMLEMLRMGPWKKLPLTVRWMADRYHREFQADLCPPMHMPVAVGPVRAMRVQPTTTAAGAEEGEGESVCHLCASAVGPGFAAGCLRPTCSCVTHITCLARHFVGNSSEDILPVEGSCPECHARMLWGDVIRKMKGCYRNLEDSP